MNDLTKAEEQLMYYLWKLDKAFLKDIVDAYPEPRPAYTTISTVLRVLVKKGVVGFETFGKSNRYFPKIKRKDYVGGNFRSILSKFFDNESVAFTSFFVNDSKLNLEELEEMKKIIEQQIAEKKKSNE